MEHKSSKLEILIDFTSMIVRKEKVLHEDLSRGIPYAAYSMHCILCSIHNKF